jgi:hypothetical protein
MAPFPRVGGYTTQPNGSQLQEIAELIDQGKVKVVVASAFHLREAAEARAALKDKHLRGKAVPKIVDCSLQYDRGISGGFSIGMPPLSFLGAGGRSCWRTVDFPRNTQVDRPFLGGRQFWRFR